MTMGYVEVETLPGCPLFPAGRRVRGQVFHFSEIVQVRVCVCVWCEVGVVSWGGGLMVCAGM
jgi:cobyrinic acid a,c-diamide synthase